MATSKKVAAPAKPAAAPEVNSANHKALRDEKPA